MLGKKMHNRQDSGGRVEEIVENCSVCGEDILIKCWAQRKDALCHKHLCLQRTKARYKNDEEYRRKRQQYGREYYHKKKSSMP
jgi:hypothetical protein